MTVPVGAYRAATLFISTITARDPRTTATLLAGLSATQYDLSPANAVSLGYNCIMEEIFLHLLLPKRILMSQPRRT